MIIHTDWYQSGSREKLFQRPKKTIETPKTPFSLNRQPFLNIPLSISICRLGPCLWRHLPLPWPDLTVKYPHESAMVVLVSTRGRSPPLWGPLGIFQSIISLRNPRPNRLNLPTCSAITLSTTPTGTHRHGHAVFNSGHALPIH